MTLEPKKSNILVEENFVKVREFVTRQEEIIKYFNDLPKSTDYEEKLENLIKLGVVVAKFAGTTENVSFIQKEFNTLLLNFQKLLDTAHDDNSNILKEHLDIQKENSPLSILAAYISNEMEKVKAVASMTIGQQKAENNTTLKGDKFEDEFVQVLESIAKKFGDEIEGTGKKRGELTKRLKGDFVHKVKELGKILVWETKNYDSSDLSMKEIKENLDIGLQNRKGDAIILVARNVKALPKQIGWIKEIKDNQLVIALGNGENVELHEEIIHFAYMWARSKFFQEQSKNSKIDPSFIHDRITDITDQLKTFDSIKTQCTNLNNASSKIESLSTDAKNAIKKELETILKSLN